MRPLASAGWTLTITYNDVSADNAYLGRPVIIYRAADPQGWLMSTLAIRDHKCEPLLVGP